MFIVHDFVIAFWQVYFELNVKNVVKIHCDRMTFDYYPNNIPLIAHEYLLVPADISNQINKIRQVQIFCLGYRFA